VVSQMKWCQNATLFVKSEARRKPIAATHYGNEISDLLTAELIHKNKQEFPDF